ncbi:MAG: molybdopterin converting factor subunit 1 [Verrucomicrobiia bacterium]|jgi:molybdopterin converting factor subunit 1
MKILFFANAKELTGVPQIELEVETPLDVKSLWEVLIDKFPEIERVKTICRIARNCEYVGDDTLFSNEDEVAIIPPVSGG